MMAAAIMRLAGESPARYREGFAARV